MVFSGDVPRAVGTYIPPKSSPSSIENVDNVIDTPLSATAIATIAVWKVWWVTGALVLPSSPLLVRQKDTMHLVRELHTLMLRWNPLLTIPITRKPDT